MATSTLSLLLALVAVPVFVGGVWTIARRRHGVAAAAIELGLAVLIGVVQLAVVVAVGGNHFDAMSVAYLDLVVALPLIALSLLVGGWVGRRWGLPRLGRTVSALAVLVLVIAPLLGFYATHVEPYAVSVDRAALPLPVPRAGDDVLRIGVVTDIQTIAIGGYERRALRQLQEEHPDIVLVCDRAGGSATVDRPSRPHPPSRLDHGGASDPGAVDLMVARRSTSATVSATSSRARPRSASSRPRTSVWSSSGDRLQPLRKSSRSTNAAGSWARKAWPPS